MRLSFQHVCVSWALSMLSVSAALAQPHGTVTEYGATTTKIDGSGTAVSSSDFRRYLNGLQEKIAQKAPQKFIGQATITFKINKNGSVSDAKVVKSSGMPQIDDKALAAVNTSAPFAALPTDAGASAEIQFSFDGTSKGTNVHAIRIR